MFTETNPDKGTETSDAGLPHASIIDRLQKLTPIRGRKRALSTALKASISSFTETNPDKGTETRLTVMLISLLPQFTETNPDKGTETLPVSNAMPGFNLKFTETNPDKGTETSQEVIRQTKILRVYRN